MMRTVMFLDRRPILTLAWLGLWCFIGFTEDATGQPQGDPFAAQIRPTDPLSPDQERALFELPPGFEVQLFAAEPMIQKPMNLSFDDRGRLWVTGSVDYPFPETDDFNGNDQVVILEDTDGDGRADVRTVFADGLTIPIGIDPHSQGAIVFGIPNIYDLRDHDGDDRVDERLVLYGPFGYERDTHGLNNAFQRGLDGWIYACHGFNNVTSVAGRDGHRLAMQSGNTYRFRMDGSRIEAFTRGQVNPFGMCQTPLGDWLNADCHSKPITLLLRGGSYESFGKPHDGLGFVPPVMEAHQRSTAIAGCCFLDDDRLPAPYQGAVLTGDVMTSRVHADALDVQGSSLKTRELPDLLVSRDPWFRPVDIQLGPDGAIYVADFYNRIIGHYEVPLDHPGRDRVRGRIWRITYRGVGAVDDDRLDPPPTLADVPDLAAALIDETIALLGHPNQTLRLQATDALSDRHGSNAIAPLLRVVDARRDANTTIHALWVLQRLDALPEPPLLAALEDPEPAIRTHAQRILATRTDWSDTLADRARSGLWDANAFVRRAAAETLAVQTEPEHVIPISEAAEQVEAHDVHLQHMLKIALRNQFLDDRTFDRIDLSETTAPQKSLLADALLGVPSEGAGNLLLDLVRSDSFEPSRLGGYLPHMARHVSETRIDELVGLITERVSKDIALQLSLWTAIRDGLDRRGRAPTSAMRNWTAELIVEVLEGDADAASDWVYVPFGPTKTLKDFWILQSRDTFDGQRGLTVLSSLPPGGESLTGTLRSRPFEIPSRLRFVIAGHLGFPSDPPTPANSVRLVLSDSGEEIARALAPRNDVAQPVDWDLSDWQGRRASLEIVDGLDLSAFAWVAVGRFDPPVVRVPEEAPSARRARLRQVTAMARWAGLLDSLRGRFRSRLAELSADPATAGALAEGILDDRSDDLLRGLAELIARPEVSESLRRQMIGRLIGDDSTMIPELVASAFRSAASRDQEQLASTLVATEGGSDLLLELIEAGSASPQLLTRDNLVQTMRAHGDPELDRRTERLQALAPDRSKAIDRLITARREVYRQEIGAWSVARGAKVFRERCANCHRIGNFGAVIGPQLDGVGGRGLDRLLEDLHDPNRNVDQAFATTVIALDDGRVLSGLVRRREGQTLVLADTEGRETVVQVESIEERRSTRLSLMPENLAASIPDEQFGHLMRYLLDQR